jgi:hypothetical protein
MKNKPILLMTFAQNDLVGMTVETKNTWKLVKKNTSINPKKLVHATIETLAEAIIDGGKDIFMFHFGGHADQQGIVLDGFQDLDKVRLSRLLLPNNNHNVQLMFLNGCLSYGQVGILTAKGLKAIIATNVNVDDGEAVRIATYFYKLFFEKDYTLKNAFESAEATVTGKNSFITIVNPGEIDEHQPMPSSWTLFVNASYTEVLNWKLADFVQDYEKKPNDTPQYPLNEKSSNGVLAFKTTLLSLLEHNQQNAVADILIQIKESAYDYDKVKYTELASTTSMAYALNPHNIVQSMKILIDSLKKK